MMARAITPTELGYLRSGGQKSDLYLAIAQPTVYMQARVNQATFTSYDSITEIPYDGANGTAYSGMTLYVGSTPGAYDKGMARLRLDPAVGDPSTTGIFYISETSDVTWADNDYLTVVDEIGLWARHMTQVGETTLMDYNIAYSDQHKNPLPVPVMGHDQVVWMSEGAAVITPDGSESWIPGGTITGYQWSAPGAAGTSGMTTATPTISYSAAGQYWLGLTVTGSNDKTFSGSRRVFVFDAEHMPVTQFILNRCGGSYEFGGWSFEVTMYAESQRSTVRDRARVVLFARDLYAGTPQLIGPYADGTENIICSGWIDGDSIKWNPEIGSVTFSVQGPAFWLNKLSGFPVDLKNVSADPAVWSEMQNLTIDLALWHLLMWRSTAPACMDIILSGDTRLASALEASAGSLWEQMAAIAEQSILAHPVCDRYGRLYCEVDTQYLAAADRAGIPTVMAITKQDWRDTITLERSPTSKTGVVDVSGSNYDGSNVYTLMARAPGHVYKAYGGITSVDRLLFADQDDANTIAGAILASENDEYPNVDVELAMNNRMIDFTPRQYVTLTIAEADTPRGVIFTSKKFIPREVSFTHELKSGAILTSLTVEAETLPDLAIMIVPPQPPEENTTEEPTTPTWTSGSSAYTPTPVTSPPMPPTASECETNKAYKSNGPFKIWGLNGILDAVNFRTRTATYAGIIRSSTHTHKTKWGLGAMFQTWVEATQTWEIIGTPTTPWFRIDALYQGAVVASSTGKHDAILLQRYQTGGFNNTDPKEFDAIRISSIGPSLTNLHRTTFYHSGAFDALWAIWHPEDNVFSTPSVSHDGDYTATGHFHSHGKSLFLPTDLHYDFSWNPSDPAECFPQLSKWSVQLTSTFDVGFTAAGADFLGQIPPKLAIMRAATIGEGWDFYSPTKVSGMTVTFDAAYTVDYDNMPYINMRLGVQLLPDDSGGTPTSPNLETTIVMSPAPPSTQRIIITDFTLWNICSV